MKKTVLIVGINGFLGKHLHQHLSNIGIHVFGTSHSENKNDDIYKLSVGDDISSYDFSHNHYDAIIYLTHIYDNTKSQELIDWYKAICVFFSNTTHNQIYLSSYSAHPNATSHYGTTKYNIESFFLNNKCKVVNPGLIIGDGGIFLKIKKMVKIMPIVLTPTNKTSNLIPVINIDSLSDLLSKVLFANSDKLKYVLFTEMISLKNLIKGIDKNKNVIEVDASIVLKIMIFLEKLHIKLPVSSDSLLGFIANQDYCTESDVENLK